MSLQLVGVIEDLPEGFEALRRNAEAEGFRHMSRLQDEWAAGVHRFDKIGEVLFAAFAEGRLAGIGGLTREPECAEASAALRMRRLYVNADARRQGVGRSIVSALLQEAYGHGALVTVRAGGADAAAFWTAMGFAPTVGRSWTHTLAL